MSLDGASGTVGASALQKPRKIPRKKRERYMKNRDKRLEYSGVVVPILKYLNSLPNSKAINIHGSPFCERGTPDVIGCINGRLVAFECKRDASESLADIQNWRLCEWIAAGAVVGGVSDVSHVKLILMLMGVI